MAQPQVSLWGSKVTEVRSDLFRVELPSKVVCQPGQSVLVGIEGYGSRPFVVSSPSSAPTSTLHIFTCNDPAQIGSAHGETEFTDNANVFRYSPSASRNTPEKLRTPVRLFTPSKHQEEEEQEAEEGHQPLACHHGAPPVTPEKQKSKPKPFAHTLVDKLSNPESSYDGEVYIERVVGLVDVLQNSATVLVSAGYNEWNFMTLAPSIPLIKGYLQGTVGLPEELQLHIVLSTTEQWDFLSGCFEESYLDSCCPAACRVTLHCTPQIHKHSQSSGVYGRMLFSSLTWKNNGMLDVNIDDLLLRHSARRIGVTCIGPRNYCEYTNTMIQKVKSESKAKNITPHTSQFGFKSREITTQSTPRSSVRWLPPQNWLFLHTDPCALGVFRILFGLVMFYSEIQPAINHRLLWSRYSGAEIALKFDYWEWVPILPPPYLRYHFLIMALSALGLASGICHRFFGGLFTFLYAWHFFLDASTYNNHFYKIILLGILFTVTDSSRFGRFRLNLFSSATPNPTPVKPIPYWYLFIFRFMVGAVYFYGGIAKMNRDWPRGYPMLLWIKYDPDSQFWFLFYMLGLFFSWGGLLFDLLVPFFLSHPRTRVPALWMTVYFHVSNNFMFSIGVFPILMLATDVLWVETHTLRIVMKSGLMTISQNLPPGYLQDVISNWWMSIDAYGDDIWDSRYYPARDRSLNAPKVSFDDCHDSDEEQPGEFTIRTPDAPGTLEMRKRKSSPGSQGSYASPSSGSSGSSSYPSPSLSDGPPSPNTNRSPQPQSPDDNLVPHTCTTAGCECPEATRLVRRAGSVSPPKDSRARRVFAMVFMTVFILWNVLMPFRHLLWHHWVPAGYYVHWSESGHRYSWHMMLRHKQCEGRWTIVVPSRNKTFSTPSEMHPFPLRLTSKHKKKQWSNPSYIRQQARQIREFYERRYKDESLGVYASVNCSLNGSPRNPYVDPHMELSRLERPGLFEMEKHLLPQRKYQGTLWVPNVAPAKEEGR